MNEADVIYLKRCRLEVYKDADAGNRITYFFCAEHVDIAPVGNVVMVYPYEWSIDMTPWEYADMPNTGGGEAFAAYFTSEIIPYIEKDMAYERYIGGYSLGGLFALYLATEYDLFSKVASVSGSLWYPKAKEYFIDNKISDNTTSVYVTLGSKEHLGKVSVRSSVLSVTEALCTEWEKYCNVHFEIVIGGHFTDIKKRIDNCLSFLGSGER